MKNSQISDRLKTPLDNDFFILDIDSTLVTTYQRNQAIINQFIKDQQSDHPLECQALRLAQCQLGDYGIATALNRIRFRSDNPDFQTLLNQYWRERFFSNDHLHSDQPTEGAVDWTQSLLNQSIPFIFLTARHHEKMWSGTLSSMKQLGFPITEDNLFLKKDLSVKDELYKTQTIRTLLNQHPNKNFVLIDNEPVVLNQIHTDHPQVQLVWFESCHSAKMEPPQNTPSINSFIF